MRDDRLTVCVYSDPEAIEYCALTGQAEVSDDDSIWPETQAIVERYQTPEATEERMAQLRTQNRIIISLTPERVLFSRSDGRRITRLQ